MFCFRYLHRWELDAALDVITMCSCHLPEIYPAKNEVPGGAIRNLLHDFRNCTDGVNSLLDGCC